MPWEPPAARGEGLCPEVSTEHRPAEPVPSQRCVSCGSERAAQSDSGACRAEYSQAKGQRYLGPTKELRRPSSDTPPPPTGLNDGVLAKLQRLTAPPGNQVHGRGDPELMPSTPMSQQQPSEHSSTSSNEATTGGLVRGVETSGSSGRWTPERLQRRLLPPGHPRGSRCLKAKAQGAVPRSKQYSLNLSSAKAATPSPCRKAHRVSRGCRPQALGLY